MNGWVMATSGAPVTRTIPICRAAARVRRGARPLSTLPCGGSGMAMVESSCPSRRATRTIPKMNGTAAAAIIRPTARKAALAGTPSCRAISARGSRITEPSQVSPAIASTSSSSQGSAARTRRHGVLPPAGADLSDSTHDPYSEATVCTGCGSRRSTQAEIAVALRMRSGERKAVTTETETAMVPSSGGTASSCSPTPAMMNENSPIWARESPDWIASRVPRPARKTPRVTPTVLPTSTSTVKPRMIHQDSRIITGLSCMPTATKNTAAKTSRSGRISSSRTLPSPDSAASAPARKAPSATENPPRWAIQASPKQSPTAPTTSISWWRSATTSRTARGTTSIPKMRKRASTTASLASSSPMVAPEIWAPLAAAVSRAMSSMAARSSKIRVPNTISFTRPAIPSSMKVRATIMVLEMATVAPVNRLASGDQPSRWPAA